MVGSSIELFQGCTEVFTYIPHDVFTGCQHVIFEDISTVFSHKHQMDVKIPDSLSSSANVFIIYHDTKYIMEMLC